MDGSTRNKLSTGALTIRSRNNYTRGRWAPNNFWNLFEKVSQCRSMSHSTKKEPFHNLIHALPTLIHWLHILIHALIILIHWLGFRISAPYLNTCTAYFNTLTRLSALGSISYYIEPTRLVSAANQNRAHSALGNQPESNTREPLALGSQSESSIT